MTTKVSDWMSRPVIGIDPDSSVSNAPALLHRRPIHCLVVSWGIITTGRDKTIAQDLNPAETRVREILTAPVMDYRKTGVSIKMRQHNIHHRPVVDESGP